MAGRTRRGFFQYFTTEAGRKYVFAGACCTGISLFVGNFVPQTILLDKYREIVQCYRYGLQSPLDEKVLKRVEMAFEKLQVNAFERKLIKPFSVFGFDMFHAGSTKYRFGGILGIPTNYSYDSVTDINTQEVRFRNELIDWSSDNGKILQESILLTEDEQIFGICKAILEIQTHRILLNSIYPTASFLAVYTFGSVINQKSNLYARPFSLRLVLYSILSLFGIGLWSFLKDFTQVKYDTEVDKALCELGPEFVEAGVRFYDKILKKNIALRNMIGSDVYTALGNDNYFLRQKSLPLTIRKSYFEMRMRELKKQLDDNNAIPV